MYFNTTKSISNLKSINLLFIIFHILTIYQTNIAAPLLL